MTNKYQPPYDWLDLILKTVQANQKELAQMAADLSALQAAVAKLGADVDAALAALSAAKANEADKAVVDQLTAELTAASGKIAAAVTPAA